MSAAVMKECGKRRVFYRSAAVTCAGDVSAATGSPSFHQLAELLAPFLLQVGRLPSFGCATSKEDHEICLKGKQKVVEEEEDWEELNELEKTNRVIAFEKAAFVALSMSVRAELAGKLSSFLTQICRESPFEVKTQSPFCTTFWNSFPGLWAGVSGASSPQPPRSWPSFFTRSDIAFARTAL